MRLYTDSEGNWRGTQADARKDLNLWQTQEVPTSKAELLEFLNAHKVGAINNCLLYTSPSPRDATLSRMPSSA